MKIIEFIQILVKPAAFASGWTSAILCFSAATGFWISGEHRRAVIWLLLGAAEVLGVLL